MRRACDADPPALHDDPDDTRSPGRRARRLRPRRAADRTTHRRRRGIGRQPGRRATPGAAPADDVTRATLPTPATKVAALWSTAGDPHPLDRPIAVALGPDGRLYVIDAGPARIAVFDRDGRFLADWGGAGGDAGQFRFRRPGQCRDAPPEDCAPDDGGGVAVDGQGRVYIADYGNNRVQVFSPEGHVLAVWGREGGGPGEFRLPQGIAVDGRGHVYVSDGGNDRVQEFDDAGRFLTQWGGQGKGEGQFVTTRRAGDRPAGAGAGDGDVEPAHPGVHRRGTLPVGGELRRAGGARGLTGSWWTGKATFTSPARPVACRN